MDRPARLQTGGDRVEDRDVVVVVGPRSRADELAVGYEVAGHARVAGVCRAPVVSADAVAVIAAFTIAAISIASRVLGLRPQEARCCCTPRAVNGRRGSIAPAASR